MPDQLPLTGLVRVKVLQVNTLSRGETVHNVKARVLPRAEGAKPVHLQIRDDVCPRAPLAGDRLKLTMQVGQVAGVVLIKPRSERDSAADDAE